MIYYNRDRESSGGGGKKGDIKDLKLSIRGSMIMLLMLKKTNIFKVKNVNVFSIRFCNRMRDNWLEIRNDIFYLFQGI